MYGSVHSSSSNSKTTSVVAVCGCAAVFAVAGFVATQPRSFYAPVAVRPVVQTTMTSAPITTAVRPSFISAARVEAYGAQNAQASAFAQRASTFAPIAMGVGALAALVAALLHKSQSVAMASTTGERLVWFPNATPPDHLTGEFPGDRGFDPLGLAKDPKVYERMRIAEVFHGRLAMLGIVGCIVPELLFHKSTWFDLSNFDVDRITLVALQVSAPLEYWRGNGGFSWDGDDGPDRSYPGFDPLNLTTEETKLKEIKNGRLAMTAMLGLAVQNAITGKSPLINLSEHLSNPLSTNILTGGGSVAMFAGSGRKFAPAAQNEHKDGLWFPGIEAPAHLQGEYPADRGFDPLNLAADPVVFARMRVAEVFHARLAMLAMVGALVPELLGKGAWFEAGSSVDGLKLGILGMLISAPSEYWRGQGGFGWEKGEMDRSYPGFDPLKLTTDYTKSAEIKNGRLAMAGALGLTLQYLATGESPLANLSTHLANPLGANITTTLA